METLALLRKAATAEREAFQRADRARLAAWQAEDLTEAEHWYRCGEKARACALMLETEIRKIEGGC